VWGPTGTAARLARAYDLPAVPGMTGEFAFHVYDDDPFAVGPFSIRPFPVVHPVAAFALRVTAGDRTLAYSGDTGICPGLEEAADRADLFLVEASFRERDAATDPPEMHLTGREAAEVARRARAGRTLLTHVPAWHDREEMLAEARAHHDGDLALAEPGATYDV
jgi:ribonuclease BN (tRNA processing enzyme)